jgi:hypothetical protein
MNHRLSYREGGATYINSGYNYILLIAMSLIFWVAGYAESVGYPVYGDMASTPIWNVACSMLPDKAVAYIIGILLLCGGAFLIHRANYMLIIIREKTFLPFLFYIILIGCNVAFLPLTPVSVGVFCLIIALYQVLSTYNNPKGILQIYNATLLIGAGSLLWVQILWFVPVFWWAMYSFKSWSLRTFLASLIGLGTLYWFLLGWCVLTDDYQYFTFGFSSLGRIGLPVWADIRTIDLLYLACLSVIAILSMLNIFINEYEENIRTRHFLFFIILLCVVSFGLSIVYEMQSGNFLQICCMPLSILMAHFFSTSRMKRIHWVYFGFLILFVLLSVLRSPWSFLPPDVLGD